MKRILFIMILFVLCTTLFAQKVYKGNSSYTSDVICNLKEGKVYSGNSSYSSDIICNIRNGKIYRKNSSYTSDIIWTVRDGKVYKGSSTYTSDIIFTIRNGKIYKGTSTYNSDIIANVKDGKVRTGTSSYNSDIQFHYDGNMTLVEFMAVYYTVMYVWQMIIFHKNMIVVLLFPVFFLPLRPTELLGPHKSLIKL